jgi:hypothetical protein
VSRSGSRWSDPRRLDLALGAYQALGHRRLADQERAGDLVGAQAAERPQGERDLRVGGERRMAAGEDELESLVRERRVQVHVVLHGLRHLEQARLRRQRAVAADAIDGPVARRRDQPVDGVGGDPVSWPALGGDGERLLRGFLGEVEVAEEADERSEDAAPLLAEDLLEDR